MFNLNRAKTCFYWSLLGLAFAPAVFAADPATSQPYSWPMWHGMHGHYFWWIFPLMFFIMLVVVIVFMMRGCSRHCMWCNRVRDESEMKRQSGEQSETALEILNKRYARGEIDKQEYEEKKAAIAVTK